jgi:proteasome lid subunit RPN8/RPN11
LAGPDFPARADLAEGIAAAIHDAAGAAAPRECCGLLEGTHQGGAWRIAAVHPARNLAAGPDRFEIDPAGHFAAVRAARARGAAIVGCYHSHPGGQARPSAADLAGAGAGADDFLWLIAADGMLGAFACRGGQFVRIALGAGR